MNHVFLKCCMLFSTRYTRYSNSLMMTKIKSSSGIDSGIKIDEQCFQENHENSGTNFWDALQQFRYLFGAVHLRYCREGAF